MIAWTCKAAPSASGATQSEHGWATLINYATDTEPLKLRCKPLSAGTAQVPAGGSAHCAGEPEVPFFAKEGPCSMLACSIKCSQIASQVGGWAPAWAPGCSLSCTASPLLAALVGKWQAVLCFAPLQLASGQR